MYVCDTINVHLYVCMYVCDTINVHLYVCMYVIQSMYISMYVCMYVIQSMYISMYVCMYVIQSMYMYACMYELTLSSSPSVVFVLSTRKNQKIKIKTQTLSFRPFFSKNWLYQFLSISENFPVL